MKEGEIVPHQIVQEIEARVDAEFEPRAEVLGTTSELALFKDLGFDGQPSRQTR